MSDRIRSLKQVASADRIGYGKTVCQEFKITGESMRMSAGFPCGQEKNGNVAMRAMRRFF